MEEGHACFALETVAFVVPWSSRLEKWVLVVTCIESISSIDVYVHFNQTTLSKGNKYYHIIILHHR